MTTFYDSYRQTTAFARLDGALLGALWAASFASFLANFGSPAWGLLWLVIVVSTPFVALWRLRRFRDEVSGGSISFLRACVFTFLVFVYASLILALVQLLYLQFLDHGFLLAQYTKMFADSQFQELMAAYGMNADQMNDAMTQLQALRPVDLVLQIMMSNIFVGSILSLPIALMGMKRKR